MVRLGMPERKFPSIAPCSPLLPFSYRVIWNICIPRRVNKCGNHDGTFSGHRGVTAAEPRAVVILEAGPIITPLHCALGSTELSRVTTAPNTFRNFQPCQNKGFNSIRNGNAAMRSDGGYEQLLLSLSCWGVLSAT